MHPWKEATDWKLWNCNTLSYQKFRYCLSKYCLCRLHGQQGVILFPNTDWARHKEHVTGTVSSTKAFLKNAFLNIFLQFNTKNNTTRKNFQLLMLKGKVDLNYMNTNVVYIKKQTKKAKQNIYLILHNILLTPIWKKFPTYSPKYTGNKQLPD